jgi:hypothetical protein
MLNQKEIQKKLPNGDLEGGIVYPEQEVEIEVKGEKHVIGTQPAHTIFNIVKKDSIPTLRLYLEEQFKEIEKRAVAAANAMKPFDGIEAAADKFENCLKLIPKDDEDKSRFHKRLDKTNVLADQIMKYLHAKKNLEILDMNVEKIKKQIDFIAENY